MPSARPVTPVTDRDGYGMKYSEFKDQKETASVKKKIQKKKPKKWEPPGWNHGFNAKMSKKPIVDTKPRLALYKDKSPKEPNLPTARAKKPRPPRSTSLVASPRRAPNKSKQVSINSTKSPPKARKEAARASTPFQAPPDPDPKLQEEQQSGPEVEDNKNESEGDHPKQQSSRLEPEENGEGEFQREEKEKEEQEEQEGQEGQEEDEPEEGEEESSLEDGPEEEEDGGHRDEQPGAVAEAESSEGEYDEVNLEGGEEEEEQDSPKSKKSGASEWGFQGADDTAEETDAEGTQNSAKFYNQAAGFDGKGSADLEVQSSNSPMASNASPRPPVHAVLDSHVVTSPRPPKRPQGQRGQRPPRPLKTPTPKIAGSGTPRGVSEKAKEVTQSNNDATSSHTKTTASSSNQPSNTMLQVLNVGSSHQQRSLAWTVEQEHLLEAEFSAATSTSQATTTRYINFLKARCNSLSTQLSTQLAENDRLKTIAEEAQARADGYAQQAAADDAASERKLQLAQSQADHWRKQAGEAQKTAGERAKELRKLESDYKRGLAEAARAVGAAEKKAKDWKSKYDQLNKNVMSKAKKDLEEAQKSLTIFKEKEEIENGLADEAKAEFEKIKPFVGCQFIDFKGKIRISKSIQGSPADSAGMDDDDVVTSVDKVLVTSKQEFTSEITKHLPGDDIVVRIERMQGGKMHIHDRLVTVGSRQHTLRQVRELRRKAEGAISKTELQAAWDVRKNVAKVAVK